MLSKLIVFALIGLFAGGAARLFYPRREFMKILGTMVLGMVGALLGGLLALALWSDADSQYSAGTLLMSAIGALVALMVWASVAYARSIAGQHG